MKGFYSKTIRAGKLTVSIIPYEIVLVYLGKRKIFIKTFRFHFLKELDIPGLKEPLRNSVTFFINRFSLLTGNRRVFVLTTSGLISVLIIAFLYAIVPHGTSMNDDEVKQRLLNEAHYTTPKAYDRLVLREHKVKRGENLSTIAHKYGVSTDTICGSNSLRSYDLISEGIVLKIPNRDGILHKLTKGTTVVSLAQNFRVPLRKILDQNNFRNPDFVSVGTTVFIPDAKPQNMVAGFIWPTRSRFVTCGFGWRRNPFNWSEREFHMGLDIRSTFEWIRGAKFGMVSYAGWLGGYGRAIIVAHPGGWKTLYAHLSRIIVRNGQYIKQGQTIGMSGNTGRSTGTHLHFEMINNGKHQNPYRYLLKYK